MLEQAQKVVPRIVEELSGVGIHLGSVFRVLQMLLAQRISVRDLPVILEALAAEGSATKDPAELAERIRPLIGARDLRAVAPSPTARCRCWSSIPRSRSRFSPPLSQDQQALTDPAVLRQVSESIRKASSEAAAKMMEMPGDRGVAADSPDVRTRRAPRLASYGGARLRRHSGRHRTQHRRKDCVDMRVIRIEELTPNKSKPWPRRCSTDGEIARLVESYIPLVLHQVDRAWLSPRIGLTREDLVSAGCYGLLLAARKFDPSRGVGFGVFARPHVHGALMREIQTAMKASGVGTEEVLIGGRTTSRWIRFPTERGTPPPTAPKPRRCAS